MMFENLLGSLQVENVDCSQNCMKYINRLASLDMTLWPMIGGMEGKHMTSVLINIDVGNSKTVTAQKDFMNNMIIDGFEFILFEPKSVTVVYRIPVKNTWNVQDLIASEIFNHPYKVKSVVDRKLFKQITLAGVL